jgi:amino acid adenylation domain-containing protein
MDMDMDMDRDRSKTIDEKLLLFSSKFAKQREYWEDKLSKDLTKTGILLKDKWDPAPGRDKNKRASLDRAVTAIHIPDRLAGQIEKLSKNSDLSIYMILLTGLNVLISRYMDNREVVIISPVYTPRVSGYTINDCVFIHDFIADGMTFKELLLEVRHSTLSAYENQDYPSAKLVENFFQPGGTPDSDRAYGMISDVWCLLENIHDKKAAENSREMLVFSFVREDRGIKGNILYDPFACESVYIEQMVRHFVRILEEGTADVNKKLSSISLLSVEEKRQLVLEFNNQVDTTAQYSADRVMHELFADQVERTPDSAAVVGSWRCTLAVGKGEKAGETVQLTYKELDRKSGQLAHTLREKGVRPDTVVGIMVERSVEMIIGIMGILKAGGAYLPIEPDYPGERIDYMLKDSNAKVLLSEVSELSEVSGGIEVIDLSSSIVGNEYEEAARFTHAAHLCYVIYTSGTTGKPKGIMLEHRSLINLVGGLKERIYGQYNEKMRVAVLSPYVFDASVKQFFGALFLGYALYIVPGTVRVDAFGLLAFYRKHGIDVSDGTPTHIRLLIEVLAQDQNENIPGLPVKHFIIGGEVLSRQVVEDFFNRIGTAVKITNVYGPTECCVDTTSYELSEEDFGEYNHIPIGKPMPRYYVYILGRKQELQPVGAAGELCVSGTGVARGYLNNPGLTAEKFIEYRSYRTHRTYRSKKIYRTGDLARWMWDGNIVFLGRLDQQVKIRGYRIELEEIEKLLLNHKVVKEVVVAAREGADGDRYLCAYIVPCCPGSMDERELREYLSCSLQDYLIPSYFTEIDVIPLTRNGKVDRRVLPSPVVKGRDDYTPPRGSIEKKVAAIWAEVLGVNREVIGIDSNFFELGGHSLKATMVVLKIHRELEVKLPLEEFFNKPFIREIAATIEGASGEKFEHIEGAEKKAYYPLSSGQKRLYIQQQKVKDNISYHIPFASTWEADMDGQRFEAALKRLIKRHESLRTSFRLVDGEPFQVIRDDIAFGIEYIEKKSAGTGLEEKEESLEALLNDFIRPFDLSRAPLFRVGTIALKGGKKILIIDIHHIITDGTSQEILRRELMALYRGEELSPLRIQYKDFTEWQNRWLDSGRIEKQEKFWMSEFEGDIPLLRLPLNCPRPSRLYFEGSSLGFRIAERETAILREMALNEGITLFMVLLAICFLFLSKLSRQEDIIIGIPVSSRRHEDLQNLIGFFVNTLALRNFPGGEKSFKGFLQEVKERTLKAFENQDYQLETLVDKLAVDRVSNRNPLFDVMFALQDFNAELLDIPVVEGGDPYIKTLSIKHTKTSKFDLLLIAREDTKHLYITLEYNTKLFLTETVERFIKYFKEIAASVCENIHRDIKLKDIKISHDFFNKRIDNPPIDFGF